MSLLFFPLAVCHISRTVNYIPIGNIITLTNIYSDFILCQNCGKKLGSLFLIGLLSFAAYIFESSWDKKILQHRTWAVVETSSSSLAEHCMFASG